jgi:transcriptional regulator with PAS, ATPase and Fis domain
MTHYNWTKEFKGAITVCDKEGKILQMNDKAIATFEKYGGEDLIGKDLLDCHPEPSKTMLKEMLLTEKANSYTIEKNGVKKLIYQSPWYENQKYMGFVELSLEIPMEMSHFVRK